MPSSAQKSLGGPLAQGPGVRSYCLGRPNRAVRGLGNGAGWGTLPPSSTIGAVLPPRLLKAARLKRLRVAVPPRGEQRRIVARVDDLMALCGRLELQPTSTQSVRRQFLEAVLDEVTTDSDRPAEMAP